MSIRTLAASAVLALIPVMASAATFEFPNGGDRERWTVSADGITMSTTAGVYDGTTITDLDVDDWTFGKYLGFDGYGIGVDGFSDEDEDIDGKDDNDLLTFYFSQAVKFVSVSFGGVDVDDDFDLFIDGVFAGADDRTMSGSKPYSLAGYQGTFISFGADDDDDNYRISSITVQPVPLPAGAVLLLSGLGLLAARRRKG